MAKRAPAATRPELKKLMLEDLKRSGLATKEARQLGAKPITGTQAEALGARCLGSYVIPYHDLDGKVDPYYYRVRYLETPKGFAASKKKPDRYYQPKNTTPRVYLPKTLSGGWSKVARDPKRDVTITEGEKKAAKACAVGIATLGIGGVWSWKSGRRNIGFLQQLEAFDWDGRTVYLCFDNDLSYKDDVIKALNALANELSERGAIVHIRYLPEAPQKIGLDDYLLDATPDDYEQLQTVQFTTNSVLWELQERLALIESVGLVYDTSMGRPDSFLTSRFKMTCTLSHYNYVNEEGKRVIAIDRWLDWAQKRRYRELTYRPGEPALSGLDDDTFNLWRGWGLEPKQGNVKPFVALVDYLFSSAEPSFKEWVWQWLAYPLQYPGAKMNTALIVYGAAQGTGKTFFGRILAQIYGIDNYSKVTESELHSQFNDWYANKQFVIGEEITGSDSRRDANRLKDVITGKELLVNRKYVQAYAVPNVANFYFTSNFISALFLSESDRRFAVHEAPRTPKPDSFYQGLDSWFNSGGAAALFWHLLYEVDTTSFNPEARAPESEAKQQMVEAHKNPVERFVLELAIDPDSRLNDGVPVTSELLTEDQLAALFDEDEATHHARYPKSLRSALASAFFDKRRFALTDPITRRSYRAKTVYAIRNVEAWERRTTREWADYWAEQHPQFSRSTKHRANRSKVVSLPKKRARRNG